MKVFTIIWRLVLGFFLTLFAAFILQKISVWFSLPYLMNQDRMFFIGVALFADMVYLITHGGVYIDDKLTEIVDKEYGSKDDKDMYEHAKNLVAPFLKGLIYVLTLVLVYVYYLILV